MSVLAPNPVTLLCTARGEPSPQIVWIKETNGMEERLNATIAYSASMSMSTLTIDPTDALDTANYSCMAQNLISSARSQAAEVTVFGEYIVYSVLLCTAYEHVHVSSSHYSHSISGSSTASVHSN